MLINVTNTCFKIRYILNIFAGEETKNLSRAYNKRNMEIIDNFKEFIFWNEFLFFIKNLVTRNNPKGENITVTVTAGSAMDNAV